MIHLGIIGAGTIFEKHYLALGLLPNQYSLTAVYDVCEKSLSKVQTLSPCIKQYMQLDDLLNDSDVDAILVATPPHTHFHLAKACLEASKHVLLEKPAVLSLKELELLYKISQDQNRILHIAYHASFAVDLLWFLQNQREIANEYGLGNYTKITCHFYDPYIVDGKLIEDRKILGGSLIDSGVNALSVCNRLANLSNVARTHQETKEMQATIISSLSRYQDASLEIEIHTGWNKGLNQKKTILTYSNNTSILMEHTLQTVELIRDGKVTVLFPKATSDRLTTQYKNVFEDFYQVYCSGCENKIDSLNIHKLLLE